MKHSIRFSVIAVLFILCISRNGYTQTSYTGLLQYQFPLLSEYPPLSLGMSYDVLVAYIFADSMGRTYPGDSIIPLRYSMGYSDTLQQAARFLYEADDYDPVTFFQWKYTDPTHRYWISWGVPGASPGGIANITQSVVQRTFPDTGKTAMLLDADYIADVTVNSTVEGYDSSAAPGAVHDVKVTCTVLDPIKGQVLPACIPDPPPVSGGTKNGIFKTQSAMGGCLQFEYCLEWNRMGPNLNMGDTNSLGNTANGRRWVHLDSEYIVFPEFGYTGGGQPSGIGGCTDTSHVYAGFLPVRWFGHSCGIYPVIGGIVYDPYNDFGFGTGLTVSQWKTALRAKIYSITHPGIK